MEGQLHTEVKASLYSSKNSPLAVGFIAGLGGRDVTVKDIEIMVHKSLQYYQKGRYKKDTGWARLKK